MARVVDIHAHFYPEAYLDLVEPLVRAEPVNALARARGDRRMWSVEQRLEDVERLGIGVQALSLSIPNVHFPDREAAVALCQVANDAFVDLVRRAPGRLRAFISLPLPHAEAALDELERAGDLDGVAGVSFGANVAGVPLSHPDFEPVYAEIERRGLPVFLHPMRVPGAEAMVEFNLEPMAGYLFDTTLAAMRLVFSGVCERHPGLRFILPHLGGTLPYIMGRAARSYARSPGRNQTIGAPPETYFRRFYYDTLSNLSPALRFAAELFGPGQLLFGSDYPFVTDIAQLRQDVADAGLRPADEDAVLGGNAARLLNLDRP